MQVQIDELRPYLQAFDFPHLLVEGLGWDYYQAEPLVLAVDGHEYTLRPVAEKAQFAVFECAPGSQRRDSEYPVRRKIETQVAKRAFEHLIIFVRCSTHCSRSGSGSSREAGKPAACREHRSSIRDKPGYRLVQRLR